MIIENDLSIKIIDFPEVATFLGDNSTNFMEALAEIDTLAFFENSTIRAIIDFKWPLSRYYIILFLFVPFLIYLALYIFFSNVLNK